MTGTFRFAVFAGLLLLLPSGSVCQTVTREPANRAVFTSTRTVTALRESADGAVWVGTNGGVRRRDPATGVWETFTREHGLPAHEARGFFEADGKTGAVFADGSAARYAGGGVWETVPRRVAPPSSLVAADIATDFRVRYGEARFYRGDTPGEEITLPEPVAAREITALCLSRNGAGYVGTRRHGVFYRHTGASPWQAIPAGVPEPADHNAQAITFFRGAMFVSTLQNGLVVRESEGEWTQYLPPTLSTDAPRQLLVYKDSLYVRHGSGAVDRFDGAVWTKNVWAHDLPRKQVSAMATDGERLYAAQWGGVSVFDGAGWRHFLREPGLQGVPHTAILPVNNGDTLYIGTQGRGLVEMDGHTGAVRRVWNEANGLSDDWITALAQAPDGTLYAGTFVGGLVQKTPGAERFTPCPNTAGENVTDILPLAGGGVVAATRFGVRVVSGSGVSLPAPVTGQTVEAQCVARSPRGETWVGTRTGIYRVSASPALSSPR